LEELTERLRAASAAKIETDEAIFRRVSQDLHDGPTQGLALATLRMDAVESAVQGTAAAGDAALVAKAVESSLADVRQISTDLRLPDLRHLSLRDILALAVDQHARRTDERVDLRKGEDTFMPSGPVATTIFRVVTEALNNAARHAGAGSRTVSVGGSGRTIQIIIEDDGVGFDATQVQEGLGLKGMRERAVVLGGRLVIRSRPGGGTRVELVLPEGR
jgi:signal transduction histidine kinase